jgi:hypothetical protein
VKGTGDTRIMLFFRKFIDKARARRFLRKHKIDRRSHQLRFDLLMKHGYRPHQLIPDHQCDDFRFSKALMSDAFGLVQNSAKLAITHEIQGQIIQLVARGYMPHRLEIYSSGEVHLDYEGIVSDAEAIALAGGFDSQIEQRRQQVLLKSLNSEVEFLMKSRQSAFRRFYLYMLITTALLPINAGAADALDGSSCSKVNSVEVDGKESVMSGPRLLELFPEMSGMLDVTAFHVSNKWMGLSRLSPAIVEVALVLDGDRFEGEASVRYGGEGRDTFQATKRKVFASRDAVRAFLCAALQAPTEERDYKPYIGHTDDYPDLNFTFQGQRGPVTIFTRSQPHIVPPQWVQTPWAINYADRVFVVSAPDIDSALDRLTQSLDIRLFPEK